MKRTTRSLFVGLAVAFFAACGGSDDPPAPAAAVGRGEVRQSDVLLTAAGNRQTLTALSVG